MQLRTHKIRQSTLNPSLMNLNRLFFVFTLLISTYTFSQSNTACPFVNAGPDQSFDCSVSCTNLTATYLDIKETTSYTVESLPHVTPIPYNQIGGTAVSANTDDVWGPIITLPFPFCYYGQTYTTCKIGSNGSILFGPASGGGGHPWSFSASLNATSGIGGAGHVLGVYHDIDPSVCGSIKWFLIGNAPCRQFVVSYDGLCHFSCTSIKSSHMMVLNESTNYIDVYVKAKPTCSSWNGGHAVIGLQNFGQNGGITAPNRNTSPNWNVTTPEAWRFKPNGNPLYTLEWLNGATVVGTSPTINVCPSGTTTYTAKFTYTPCGTTTPIVITDDVTLTPAPGAVSLNAIVSSSVCGLANGSVILHATGGTGAIEFSQDSTIWNTDTVYTNLTAGTYTFYARDNGGCVTTYIANVIDQSTLTSSVTNVTNSTCYQSNNGSISALAVNGTPPYSYTLGTNSPQSTGNFTGLAAGNYQIFISDSQGCSANLTATVTEPNELILSKDTTTNSFCNLPNGMLEVSAIGGTNPLVYTIDSFATVQNNGIFTSIYADTYFVQVRDINNCLDTLTFTVNQDPSIYAAIGNVEYVSCKGFSDGSFIAYGSGGPLPYVYTLNGGVPDSTGIYQNLIAGNYSVTIADSNGCLSIASVVITEPTLLQVNFSPTTTTCAGTQVLLTATASGGTQPYSYLWNNSTSSNPLGVSPNTTTTYNISVKDSNNCVATGSVTQTVLPLPIATATATPHEGLEPVSVTIANQSSNSNTYVWDFGNGQNQITNNLNSVTANYPTAGTYYITMVASNGICDDSWTDSILVTPPLEVFVPNVFSPNNDDVNEGYTIFTRNALTIDAIIVNRWGDVMAKITDVNYKWDGKNQSGQEASEGVYFIKYKVTGPANQEQSGQTFFHLVR